MGYKVTNIGLQQAKAGLEPSRLTQKTSKNESNMIEPNHTGFFNQFQTYILVASPKSNAADQNLVGMEGKHMCLTPPHTLLTY